MPGRSNDTHLTAAAVERLRRELDDAEKISRDELTTTAARLSAELRLARLQNEVSEERDGELTSLLADASPNGSNQTRGDLATVRKQLAAVAELLPDYREEAGHRLTARLDRLERSGDVEHIRRLIKDGDLSTAEELIYYGEIGLPMPTLQSPRTDLAAFFPTVPLAIPGGIADELIDAVRGGRCTRARILWTSPRCLAMREKMPPPLCGRGGGCEPHRPTAGPASGAEKSS